MSSQTGSSILDAALACIGERISTILLQPGHKNHNYITSLHNEVVRIIQCSYMISISLSLSLDIAGCHVDCWTSATRWQLSCARACEGCLLLFFFCCFFNYRNPGSYTAPDESWLPHHKVQSSGTPWFNFTVWWNIRNEEILREPFDIHDELPNVLVGFLERVCTLSLLPIP